MPSGRRNTISDIMGNLVLQENGCCIWPGRVNTQGYGLANYQGKTQMVHRIIYQHFVRKVPRGRVLDHFHCDTPACANFAHLKAVTPRQNILRGNGAGARNARKTHCPRGHEYIPENTYYQRDGNRILERICKVCDLANRPERKARYREKMGYREGYCRQGHPFSGENLVMAKDGRRKCLTCLRERAARVLNRKKHCDGPAPNAPEA